jgi:hypothetical protein
MELRSAGVPGGFTPSYCPLCLRRGGNDSPFDVQEALHKGLDLIAVTDHNAIGN